MVIWLLDPEGGDRYVWSLDLKTLQWRHHRLVRAIFAIPGRRQAGLAVRSRVRGPLVGVYRAANTHCLVVGREVFDLSLPTSVEHVHRGPWSRLVVRQGSRTARASRFESQFLPDLVPLFKDPFLFEADEPVWHTYSFELIARRANGDPDLTAGPQDYLMDWSPWVKD